MLMLMLRFYEKMEGRHVFGRGVDLQKAKSGPSHAYQGLLRAEEAFG